MVFIINITFIDTLHRITFGITKCNYSHIAIIANNRVSQLILLVIIILIIASGIFVDLYKREIRYSVSVLCKNFDIEFTAMQSYVNKIS